MRSKIFVCAFLLCCRCSFSFAQVKVTFLINKIPAAKDAAIHLFVAGDFNNWNPADPVFEMQKQGASQWQLSKTLPSGGVYNFKITRGSWQTVECSPGGKATGNRVFKLARDTTILLDLADWQDNFAPEEKRHTASSHVHILAEKFDIPQLGRQRRIWIYLPADYGSSHKKYPVIYMHDGQNLFDTYTSGYGEWGLDEMMDQLPAKDQCIIVGVDHGGEYRMAEYNPYDSKYGKGQGDQYTDFLVKILKPFVDKHYRTRRDAAHTSVAGSSMGGLISMYAVLKYPEVFGSGGIFSPSFWIAPDIFNYARQHLTPGARLYFVCGELEGDDMVEPMEKMVKLVRQKITAQNAPYIIVKGARHNEKQWNGDFPAFYRWLSGDSAVKR